MSKMNNALNRAFEKAFAHTATKETLMDLLSCLGEELACDRIAIFETNHDGTCDNIHEWCAVGTLREQELMQGIPMERFGTWRERLMRDEVLWIRDLENVKEADPEVVELFASQGVHSVVVSKLAFHGKGLGFFVLENPSPEMFDDTEIILPGMRYILSSLVYSDHLVRRLERMGYTDRLTGTGNRVSLQEHLEALDHEGSIGIIYCCVVGWIRPDNRPEHMRAEQMLLKTGEVLTDIFDGESVFRVGHDEFIVLVPDQNSNVFTASKSMLKHLFEEHDLLVAVSDIYRKDPEESYDAMIRQAHLLALNERRMLEEVQKKEHHVWEDVDLPLEERAQISLPRGDEFFRRAEEFLAQIFDQPILTAVIDVNYFKLFNDIFGRKAGNILLEEIGISLQEEAERQNGVAGYLGGDNYCLMIPVPMTDNDRLRPFIEGIFRDLKYADGFSPVMGIYISYDRLETMITMYDRALTALQEVKGSYMEHYRFYDAEHFQHQKDDKILLMEVKEGLPKGEFIFYLQPQVYERTGKIIGAEALVRWKRGTELIPPYKFIPVLEKTGYIFAVDCFVWESVVKWLRSLLDRGIKPVPCSVNVSRVDFYFTDIAQHFIDLLAQYDIPAELLGIEITESAFTDNTDSIVDAVQRLHDAGFRILMDDFGSGSSSLSMLHNLDFDILKTDVRFMSKQSADRKAVSIVETVISMAHMIGMLVVTEGVETEEQKDNLMALGENYAQGFFFYKPMPVAEFEKLLCDPSKLGVAPRRGDKALQGHVGFKTMIREGMVSETLLDNIIGPAAVYRESGGKFELIQLNEQYSLLTGVRMEDPTRVQAMTEQFHQDEHEELEAILRDADRHPFEGATGRFSFKNRENGEVKELDVRVFLLYSCDDHKMYLSTVSEK